MLAVLTLAIIMALLVTPRVSQDLAFNRFADDRDCLFLYNYLHVLNKVPFLLVGFAGCWLSTRIPVDRSVRYAYMVTFIGIQYETSLNVFPN